MDDDLKRTFYAVEAMRGPWSVRELERQIDTKYYERSGWSKKPERRYTKPEPIVEDVVAAPYKEEVEQFLNDKIPGGVNPAKAVFDIKANIVNARKNFGEDEKGIPVQFATNMFVLAEDVLSYVEEEIEAWKEKQAAEQKQK